MATSSQHRVNRPPVHQHPAVLIGTVIISVAGAIAALQSPNSLAPFLLVVVACVLAISSYYRLAGRWRVGTYIAAVIVFAVALIVGPLHVWNFPTPVVTATGDYYQGQCGMWL